jgi:hypothetical protein
LTHETDLFSVKLCGKVFRRKDEKTSLESCTNEVKKAMVGAEIKMTFN